MKRYIIVAKDSIYQTDELFQHILDDIAYYRIIDTQSGKELVEGRWYDINEIEEV